MELVKKAGLIVLGACVATIIIFGIWHNQRIKRLENITNQIVQVLNTPRQQQPAATPTQ